MDSFLKNLTTPAGVQDFVNTLAFNFEENGDTLSSPATVLKRGSAHCFEGALVAAYALSLQGRSPLIMHLKARKPDYDHVVALFQEHGYWGAISKTNHGVLRYREPVYESIRELAMSYFHEYFLNDGTKTLVSYSEPLDLSEFNDEWVASPRDLWGIDEELDKLPHHSVLPAKRISLRHADPIERQIGTVVEYRQGARDSVTSDHLMTMAKGNDSRRKEVKKPKKAKK